MIETEVNSNSSNIFKPQVSFVLLSICTYGLGTPSLISHSMPFSGCLKLFTPRQTAVLNLTLEFIARSET